MTSHLSQIFCCFCVLKSCYNVIFQPLFCVESFGLSFFYFSKSFLIRFFFQFHFNRLFRRRLDMRITNPRILAAGASLVPNRAMYSPLKT